MSKSVVLRGLALAAVLGLTMGASDISARTKLVSEASCPGPCVPCPMPCGDSCPMDEEAACPMPETAAAAAVVL